MAVTQVIVLDSTPLGLLLHKPGLAAAEACRKWAITKENGGSRLVIPEIVDYEIRRELLREGKLSAIKALDLFVAAESNRLLRMNSADLLLAAELWAKACQQGKPTADSHALDIDVILCA